MKKGNKSAFQIFFLLLIILIVSGYLFFLKAEDAKYSDFINNEWSRATAEYKNSDTRLGDDYVYILVTDKKGRVWIVTGETLNIVNTDGSWTTYTRAEYSQWIRFVNDYGSTTIQSVTMDKSGRVWVGAGHGLYFLKSTGEWKTFGEKPETAQENYTSRGNLVDKFGRISVADEKNLNMFLPDGTKTIYTKDNSTLPDDYITALAEDSQGNIWVGTRRKGVVVIGVNGQGESYEANGSPNGLVNNSIAKIYIDNKDRVWIGTTYHGISMLSPEGKWTTYDLRSWGIQASANHYDSGQITSLVMDEKERLWIGTYDALFVLDPNGTWIAYTKNNSPLTDFARELTIDGNGKLWIATINGLTVLDLKNELPKPVPAEWLRRRELAFIPLEITKGISDWLFYPINVFYSTAICNWIYITMLISIIPLGFRIRKNMKDNNGKELKKTAWLLIIVISCIILYRFMINLIGIFPT